jgi:Na+/H+-dicarboxylate symporter
MFWRQRNRIVAVLALALLLFTVPASAASRHRGREAPRTLVSGIWEQVLTWLQSLSKATTSPTTCQGESGPAIDPNGCPRSATQATTDEGGMIDPNGGK